MSHLGWMGRVKGQMGQMVQNDQIGQMSQNIHMDQKVGMGQMGQMG